MDDLQTLRERKGSIEQSIRNAEAEFRELIKETRVYNDSIHLWMEKEFELVKTLPNELVSSHVIRDAVKPSTKRVRKKLLAQTQAPKIASRGAEHDSSSSSKSKLPAKRKNKHKISTSQAHLSKGIPGTYLTPLSPRSKFATHDGIDAILAASMSMQKETAEKSDTTDREKRVKSPNGVGQKSFGQSSHEHESSVPLPLRSPPPKSSHKNNSLPALVNKGKKDNLTRALKSNKASKHDIQLFTILDTTVSPPLPRYIAKIVPESTALIPLSSAGNATTVSPTLLTALGSTHPTSSSTHTASSPAHSTSVTTMPIPRVSSSLARNSCTVTATSSREAHKDTTSKVVNHATKLVDSRKAITPPTTYVCDQPGCKEYYSQLELLNLHKLTVHRLLPDSILKKKPMAQYSGALGTGLQKVVDGLKQIEKTSNKRARNPSMCTSEEYVGHKFIKLENEKSSLELTSPVHSAAPKAWRNFARKSTSRVNFLKRKRIAVKSVQLKLKKVSTSGLNTPKRTALQENYGPMSYLSTRKGYRNPEFFRNLIRSQLKLPASFQKATTTSDYISLHSDTEPSSPKHASGISSCTENEDYPLCARTIPFVGNCARTRKFAPEVFGKPKKQSEHDHIISSSSSISATTEEEMQLASSEDESFPLARLSPMVPKQQLTKGNSHKPPNVTMSNLRAASPQPQSVDDVAGQEDTIPNTKSEETVQSPLECEKIQKVASISMDLTASMCSTVPKSPVKSPSIASSGMDSNEYTMRLLQTIAKLSGESSIEGDKSRRTSVLSPPPPPTVDDGESSDLDDESCTSLPMSIDLSRLSRVPLPPPPSPCCPSLTEVGVFTHRLGSFTSRGAQVERGLIIDSDDLDHRLTVKVNEALCEMKEKLEKTERRVREVMKEKEQLEKMLESKLKMIKDLTTTGLKPVFADKDTMTDPVKEATANKKQTTPTMKSVSTQTKPRAERQSSAPTRCLSHLNDGELEEYLRVSPPPAPPAPSEEDDVDDASDDVVPASSKNRWMFESGDSARSSAFNVQVRFMRALTEDIDVPDESTRSSMVSSTLLSREHCSTFTKIQCINQQLQSFPLVGALKERVRAVTSSVGHLLSHLPLARGGQEEVLTRLSIGTMAYNVGWKIKELLTLLLDINTDRLPRYFKAELNLVTKQVQKALDFGMSDMRNVTVDHTAPRPEAPQRRQLLMNITESEEFDLDDILSSSSGSDNELHKLVEDEEVEVVSDRESVAVGSRRRRRRNQVGDGHSDKGEKKRHKRREKKTQGKKGGRQRRHSSPSSLVLKEQRKGGRVEKAKKPERSRASKQSKDVQPGAASSDSARPSSVSPATITNVAGTLLNRFTGPVKTSMPLILRRPTPSYVVSTPSNSGGSVTVTPINRSILPLAKGINPSNKHLTDPLRLLTSLAASLVSRGIAACRTVDTYATSTSQPQPVQSTNTTVSLIGSTPKQVRSIGTDITSGRVEVSNLSSNKFTPLMKAITSTSTSPSGPGLITTGPLLEGCQVSGVSVAQAVPSTAVPKASLIQTTKPSNLPSQLLPRPVIANPTANFSLSSSVLPPAVIAASSLLSLPRQNNLPPSLPPSVVTASVIPAFQNSTKQVRAHNLTTPPAPVMRASTLNGLPAVIAVGSSALQLATPSMVQPPSINVALSHSMPPVPVNVTPLLTTPSVAPPSRTIASSTTPTVAPPPIVTAASSHTVTVQVTPSSTTPTVIPPPIVTATSSHTIAVQVAPSLTTPTVAPPPVTAASVPLQTLAASSYVPSSSTVPTSALSPTIVSAPSSLSLATSSPPISMAPSLTTLASQASSSLSEASNSPLTTSTVATASSPTTIIVTPVEVTDILPDLPESNRSTAIVVIDPSPEAELTPAPPTTATVVDTASSSSSTSSRLPSSTVTTVVSNSINSELSNPVIVTAPSSSPSNWTGPTASSSCSLSTASTSLVELLSSSLPETALLTSPATPAQVNSRVAPLPLPKRDDEPLPSLHAQQFVNLLKDYTMHPQPTSMAGREQSMSQGAQTLSVDAANNPARRRSPRVKQNRESISPAVAALKASIYKRNRTSPRRKASRSSVPLADSLHPMVAPSPSPLAAATYMNPVTLSAKPTLEDLTMMYTQGVINYTSRAAMIASSLEEIKGQTSSSASLSSLPMTIKANGAAATPMTSSVASPSLLQQAAVSMATSADSGSILVIVSGDNKLAKTAIPSKKVKVSASGPPPLTTSESNATTTSTASQKSSTAPSLSIPSKSPSTPATENKNTNTQEILSPQPNTATIKSNFVFPDNIKPCDITPLVQVMYDTKGVLIKWTLPKKYLELQAGVTNYELYAHIVKEKTGEIPPTSQWSKVGMVTPLKLPMAVTLTNVMKTKKYIFSVRALFGKSGASQFSKPSSLREDSVQYSCPKFVAL